MQITKKHLETKVDILNRVLGKPEEGVGSIALDSYTGGHKLVKLGENGSQSGWPINYPRKSTKEMLQYLEGLLDGLITLKEFEEV